MAFGLPQRIRSLARRRLNTRGIRFQITLRVWLLLVIVFGLTNLVIASSAARMVLARAEVVLANSSGLLAYGMEHWLSDINKTLALAAFNPELQSLDPERLNPELEELARLYPDRQWRVWSTAGRVLASSGVMSNIQQTEQTVPRLPHFQKALQGQIAYETIYSQSLAQDCLVFSAPIYPTRPAGAGQPRVAIGVLSFLLPIEKVAKDSRIDTIGSMMGELAQIDPVQADPAGQAMPKRWAAPNVVGQQEFLVGSDGTVLHLMGATGSKIPPQSSLQQPHRSLSPLLQAVSKENRRRLSQVKVEGRNVQMLATPVMDDWRLVTVVDEAEVFRLLRTTLWWLLQLQIVSLLLITLFTYWSCGRIVMPLQFAGRALRQLREGQFRVALPPHARDEMGVLLDDIQQTGEQLEGLVEKQKLLARSTVQFEAARKIHANFLVRSLPDDSHYELAVYSAPALEIGADWYDVIRVDGKTLLVVADVCDKGIGSALFMSVFRTLIRYAVQHLKVNASGEQSTVCEVMNRVNEYMVQNHADALMFATVFIGLYDPETRSLEYVLAGHEQPLLLRQGSLQALELCGPALGLFPVHYVSRQLTLEPLDLLFAYTDGLVDARSPGDVSYGLDPLKQYLLGLDPTTIQAQDVLDHVVQAVRQHIAEADQFDDLTLMSFHLK